MLLARSLVENAQHNQTLQKILKQSTHEVYTQIRGFRSAILSDTTLTANMKIIKEK